MASNSEYDGLQVVGSDGAQAYNLAADGPRQIYSPAMSVNPPVYHDSKSTAYAETPREAAYGQSIGGSTTIPAESAAPKERRICGLRRTTFWLTVVIVVLVVAGAVAGGVGGALANKKSSNSSASQNTSSPTAASGAASGSSTSTSSSPSATPTVSYNIGLAGCPTANNTVYTAAGYQNGASKTNQFLKLCGIEMPGPTIDITSVKTATFDACIDACANLNFQNANNTCVACTWNLQANDYQMCYLKYAVGAWILRPDENNYLVTGVMIGRQ